MPAAPHLLRRGGIYHWRIRVPADLVRRLGGRTHLSRSLRTASLSVARTLARCWTAAAEEVFTGMRRFEDLGQAEVNRLLEGYAAAFAATEEDDRAACGRIAPRTAEERAAAAAALRDAIPGLLRENDLGLASCEAERVLAAAGLAFSADSIVFRRFARLLLRQAAAALDQAADEHRGFYRTPPTAQPGCTASGAHAPLAAAVSPFGQQPGQPGPPQRDRTAPGPRVSELREGFLQDKRGDGLAPKTVQMMELSIRTFEAVTGDPPLSEVQPAQAKEFVRRLAALPRNWRNGPGRAKLSIEECLLAAQAQGAPPAAERRDFDSVRKDVSFLSSFWNWAIAREDCGVAQNPFSRVCDEAAAKRAERTRPSEERHALSVAQMRTVFSHRIWASPPPPERRGADYWMPPAAVYAGLRLEELAGLQISDLQRIGERFFLRVEPNRFRPLKSAAATRLVPLHPVLIRLGFVDHVRRARKSGDGRVFPDLELGADGRWGSAYSKRFGRLLDRIGLGDPKLVFHSWRHSFITAMLSATGGDHDLVERLVGHSQADRGETRGRYGKERTPDELWDAVSRLSYGLEMFGEAPCEVVERQLAAPQPFFNEDEGRTAAE